MILGNVLVVIFLLNLFCSFFFATLCNALELLVITCSDIFRFSYLIDLLSSSCYINQLTRGNQQFNHFRNLFCSSETPSNRLSGCAI